MTYSALARVLVTRNVASTNQRELIGEHKVYKYLPRSGRAVIPDTQQQYVKAPVG